MEQKNTSKVKKGVVIAFGVIVVIAFFAVAFWQQISTYVFRPTESSIPVATSEVTDGDIRTVVSNIATPWAIAFLPDGDLLVTERSGQVQRIGNDGTTYAIAGVRETSEGGLLGIALHPDFESNQFVYLYSTTDSEGELMNRVERYVLEGAELQERTEILSNIPASSNHDGGALAFGPDNKLYVTTGDAGNEANAQDRQSLAGKILRINDDGSAPSDNPFSNEVWSYGHRNPQGITWDDEARMWATEHGPSGGQSGRDELNRIEKGANYGWPMITGDETRDGMRAPIVQSGDSDTWAPGGLAYADGSLYFAGLRGQSLYRAVVNNADSVSLSRHFSSEYGRLRTVAVHGDELYFSTSNRDGRGSPASQDDRIFAVPLSVLE